MTAQCERLGRAMTFATRLIRGYGDDAAATPDDETGMGVPRCCEIRYMSSDALSQL